MEMTETETEEEEEAEDEEDNEDDKDDKDDDDNSLLGELAALALAADDDNEVLDEGDSSSDSDEVLDDAPAPATTRAPAPGAAPVLPNDVNALAQFLRYHRILLELMLHIAGGHEYATNWVFNQEELNTVKPDHIYKWMCLKVYGMDDPGIDDNPVSGRSSTLREGFKTAVRAYISNAIIPDPDAKGTMIEAFEHYHMAKPKEVSERALFNRIDTILDYIDMSPGEYDHYLTEQQRKRMFFKTHPKSWQDSYMDTAVNFREVTILQIRDYMTRRKNKADKTEKGKNDRAPSREREGDEQKGIQQERNGEREQSIRRERSKGRENRYGEHQYGEMWERHPNGNHTWEQCYFNPKNRQQAPYPQYIRSNNSQLVNPNPRFGGRPGGQSGGRNNGAGRGPNQNDYGGRSGGRGNGSGAGRGPNKSNYNQWWRQDTSNYYGDAYSNITVSDASYHMAQGQGPQYRRRALLRERHQGRVVPLRNNTRRAAMASEKIPDEPRWLLRKRPEEPRGLLRKYQMSREGF
eukprot:jgi/Psemu1/17860/gm1.17860_g